jgi:hypothetical protein
MLTVKKRWRFREKAVFIGSIWTGTSLLPFRPAMSLFDFRTDWLLAGAMKNDCSSEISSPETF